MTDLIRLIVQHEPVETLPVDPPDTPGRRIQFTAHIEGTDEFVVKSHQPLADGARELLERGYDPETMLTMRHAGSPHDSFQPASIAHWAKVTYSESGGNLKSVRWMPFPGRRNLPGKASDR